MSIEQLERENAELKAANLKLEKKLGLMQTIFDSLSEGVVASSIEGEFLLANPRSQEIAGMGPDAGEGAPEEWAETYGTFYPDEATPVPSTELPLYKAMQGETTNNVKLVLRNPNRPDGIFISASGRPLYDENGVLMGGVIVMHDITQLEKLTEQLEKTVNELQKQNTLMDTVFNSISDGVIVSNQEGEFLIWNPVAEEIVGIGATEGDPEEWSDTYGTFYQDKVTPFPSTELPLYKAMQGEITNDVRVFIRNQNRPDGVLISVDGRPLSNEHGKIGGVVVFRDITQLDAVKRELETTVNELQNRQNLVDIVFDSISDGVVVANEKGEFLFFNEAAKKIVGIGPTKSKPEEWADIYGSFYPDKVTPIPSTELPLYKAINGEITDDLDLFIRNQNRKEGIFVKSSGRPLLDETNTLIGGVVVFRDVTQLDEVKRQLQTTVTELQTQNALMDAIFNSISDGIIVADKDGKYVMFNETVRKMAGQDPNDVSTMQAPETFGLFQPDGQTYFPADKLPLERTLQGEHPDNVEMFIRNPQLPDGIDASISARPIYDENGVVQGGVSIIRDVSERKAAETKLTAVNDQLMVQSQLLQSIFDSISDGVFVADEAGTIIMANPSARQMADILKDVVEPDEWSKEYNFFYSDKVTPFPLEELPLMSAIRGESVEDIEMFVTNEKTPEGMFLSVSGKPLQNDEGKHTGGVVVFRDITERVRRQEALTQAFAQGRLEIVDTILHNIGNAINSVTVGIDTVYNMLADDLLSARLTALAEAMQQHEDNLSNYIENDPQGQKVLPFLLTLAHDFKAADQALRQTVERIRDRTRHIVDIIRTQNSYQGTSGTHKDINLADAISDAVKIMQESIDKRQIQVEIDFHNTPEEIRIQESQFHQMLVNLIKNSIEAIDELAKTGALNEAPCIQILVHTDDDFLNIDIKDNGIGIEPENIKRIFSAGYTTKEQGSGLGLHSSANFVIGTGGKIESCSEGKGKGATVRIMLRRSAVEVGDRAV